MSDSKREGAVIYPTTRRVRLRDEPKGFFYELNDQDEGAYIEVSRLDTLLDQRAAFGRIRREGTRLVPEKTGNVATDDALRLVARAWSRLPLLKAKVGRTG